MPQTSAAKKALRVNARRRTINDRWRRRLRESLHTIREAISSGDAKAAQSAFQATQKVIDRASQHRVLHPRTAARQKSRFQQAIAKLGK